MRRDKKIEEKLINKILFEILSVAYSTKIWFLCAPKIIPTGSLSPSVASSFLK